jgi:nicotinamide-nucleotide amidase
MSAAIVSIGSELVRGEVADTNARWLASRLSDLGFDVGALLCLDDDEARIASALQRLGDEVDVVLVTGGLGPTPDDRTVAAAARAAGTTVVRDPETYAQLCRRLNAAGKETTAALARQTEVPKGATVLGNPVGVVPAFSLGIGRAECFFMPGPPAEMEQVFEALVTRSLMRRARPQHHRVVLRTYGLSEPQMAERLGDLEALFSGIQVGYRAMLPEVDIALRVRDEDPAAARALVDRAAATVRARLGDAVFGEGDDSYAAAVGGALRRRGYTLAVAESCTGGLIGSMLTAVPGSSDYLLLDAVTYSNAAKERVLGVSAEVLRGYGAVSAECVRAMAEGARRLTGAELSVSVSGVAGPGGGTAEKPVGLVYFALASSAGTEVVERHFRGDRAAVQRQAAYVALCLVRSACMGPVPSPQPTVCG